MMSPAPTGVATAAMMVAMMLPAVAPGLWRHHRHLREMQMTGAGEHTAVFALGYAGVWSAVSLALSAMSTEVNHMTVATAAVPIAPWAGVAIVCVGIVQRSRWKATQLVRCLRGCESVSAGRLTSAWWEGCRLGVNCVLSCAAPMAILYIGGFMDTRLMLLITAAITAERAPTIGPRIAQLTGACALIAGFVLCV